MPYTSDQLKEIGDLETLADEALPELVQETDVSTLEKDALVTLLSDMRAASFSLREGLLPRVNEKLLEQEVVPNSLHEMEKDDLVTAIRSEARYAKYLTEFVDSL